LGSIPKDRSIDPVDRGRIISVFDALTCRASPWQERITNQTTKKPKLQRYQRKTMNNKIAAIFLFLAMALNSCMPAGWDNLTRTERGVWERCLNSVQAAQCPANPHVISLPDVSQTVCTRDILETFCSLQTDLQRREYLQSVGCPPAIAQR
jgi:hypothetical protein